MGKFVVFTLEDSLETAARTGKFSHPRQAGVTPRHGAAGRRGGRRRPRARVGARRRGLEREGVEEARLELRLGPRGAQVELAELPPRVLAPEALDAEA